MIHETFVATTPQVAYANAMAKYGKFIKLISAKHVAYDDGEIMSEITVGVPRDVFIKKSMIEESSGTHIKAVFLQRGIDKDILDEFVSSLEMMGHTHLNDDKYIASYIIQEMDNALQIERERLDKPKIIMLVGPTGVGKTTTIAKLSTRYKKESNFDVRVINLDSYKVGAFEQLEAHTTKIEVPHTMVKDLDLFTKEIESFDNEIILIDTVGISPYDRDKFTQILEFVKSNTDIDIEVKLILSATLKCEDMYDIYNSFEALNLSSLIITKFDETKHFADVLNFVLKSKIKMSYFCIGQDIENDISVASREYLLDNFISGMEKI
ncbi:MAG: flagellar biosynthesis protein FlhF [Sulfurovum sp.]